MNNLRDLRNLREIKKSTMRKLSQISPISTDFQNINDVWICGICGICVGKSENAAENTAFVFSLTESCRLHGINPETYLEKLFKYKVNKETYDKRQFLPSYIKI